MAAAVVVTSFASPRATPVPAEGNASAVNDLLERVLPQSSSHFELELAAARGVTASTRNEHGPPGNVRSHESIPKDSRVCENVHHQKVLGKY